MIETHFGGHDTSTDPFYVSDPTQKQDDDASNGATQGWAPSGGGKQNVPGQDAGSAAEGPSQYDIDVAADRAHGAQFQQAPQLDLTQANQSRGLQMGALGLMQQAATGNAPSRAAALGQAGTDAAIRGAMANTAAARGPGASVAAMHGAQMGAGQQMGALNAGIMEQRAQEMAHAQQGYAGATQSAEGQDINAATVNAQLEQQQRALNEQHQQANEGLAWNVRHSQMQNANTHQGLIDKRNQDARAVDDANNAQTWGTIKDIGSASSGLLSGGLSDVRSKTRVIPMGSLGHLMRGR